jgi:hypothetical protein
MSIQRFFKTAFTIYRMVWDTSDTSELQSVGTFKGHRQQASAELIQTIGIAYGKGYKIWCPLDADIKLEDILSDTEDSYSVRAINERDYSGGNKHLELIVETNENYVSV